MAILIKNVVNETKAVEKGNWDSSNFFTVKFATGKAERTGEASVRVNYTLTSTVILQMESLHKTCGTISVSGSLTRQLKKEFDGSAAELPSSARLDHDLLNAEFHVEHLGKLVEEMEGTIRNQIEEVYLRKSKEVNSF